MITIGPRGLALIKSFESLQLKAYPDPGTGGKPWTIGYGHTYGVKPGDTCTETEAEELLLGDLLVAEEGVDRLVKVPLTEGQRDALISFAFNVGLDEDTDDVAEGLGDSTLLKVLNMGWYDAAADEFKKWNRSGGKVLNGLTRRRKAEEDLFRS